MQDHRLILLLTIANLGVALGALWEIAEYVAELGEPDMETRMDTVMDLACGAIQVGPQATVPASARIRHVASQQAERLYKIMVPHCFER